MLTTATTKLVWYKTFVFYSALFAALLLGFAGNAQTVQTFSNSGASTWTCPTGVTSVTVECYGAGGAGGGASNSTTDAGGGGGGGGYAMSVLTVVPGTVYSYSVGNGPNGQAGGSATQASPGTGSWFNTAATIFAGGGTGGFGSTSATPGANGVGGSGNIGTITRVGGNGGSGVTATAGGGGGAGADGTVPLPSYDAVGTTGGSPGVSGGNTGAYGGSGSTNGTGNGGDAFGGGGGGARRSSGGNKTGGAGADGAVVLTYCSTLSVTTQPTNVSGLCSGNNTSFSIVASGSPTTYQWQRDPNTGTFADITSAAFDANVTYSGYNAATLNLTSAASSLNNYKYRCVITSAAPCSQTVTSSSATLAFTITTPLSGLYTIGGAGSPSYPSLTAAFAAMNCAGVSGNVSLALQSGYVSTVETFPIATYSNNGTYSVTIYPAASGLSITSANTNETINLNGSDYYVFDGRVNQAGAMDLIIENTTTNGIAIQLINDASYNTIKYCNIKGSNTSVVEGVVLLSTASSTGNDYNTIDHCDVHESATGTPYDGINSTGTTGSENDHNTVSNCNIYNFYINGNLPSGIDIEGGNSDWTITGNSFYQTATRTPNANSGLYPIYIVSTGNNYLVSGNFLGGTAPSCGGTALTFNSGATVQGIYAGIYIQAGTSTACIVQNNTVANILLGDNHASTNISFYGVAVGAGYVDVSSNIIGSATGNGSITLIYSTTGQAFVANGINTSATQGNVSNNTIGSISASGGKVNQGGIISLIDCTGALAADFGISNNFIGSTTTTNTNSIQYSGGSANPVTMYGIHIGTSGAFNVTSSNNVIQDITNTTTGNASTYGIYNDGSSIVTVSSNTVSNIATASPNTKAIFGINCANTTAGQSISYNVIQDISNTAAAATDDVYGIYYNGASGTTNSINGNTIYNLLLSSTATAANIYGLYINGGAATTSNNMIDLGVGVGTGYGIFGIYQNTNTANNHHYYNSVYIGGTAASGAVNTNAFYSVAATHNVVNNIFYNNRTGGTGKHFAIDVVSKTNLTSNYNDLFSSVAANLGSVNGGTAALTFANWKAAATASDGNSINVDPTFAGQTSNPANLHLNSGSPCGTVATNTTGITGDIDLQPRSTTPDIGADEYHTSYYSGSSGTLESTNTWWTTTTSSGSHPANFTTRDCVFNIINNQATNTLAGAWTVSGSGSVVVLGDGTTACNFTIPAASTLTGTLNISNNGTLVNQNTSATNPTLNILNAGSTVNYNASSTQTVTPAAYGNLILSNVSNAGSISKLLLAAGTTIAGDLTVNKSAVFDMSTFNANRTGGGGTLTVQSGGTLRFSGTTGGVSTNNNFPNNFSTMSLSAGSTTEYYGATQTIFSFVTYGNLTTTTAGTKTAGGALTIAGSLTINAASTFAASTYTHLLQGDFLNSGTFTQGSSTINFNNTSGLLQHIGPAAGTVTTFATLQINNTAGVTMQQDANVATALTLSAGLLNTAAVGSGLLIMNSGSTAPSITSTSSTYVNGPMRYLKASNGSSTLHFPIGTSPDCRPFTLTVNHTSALQYNYNAQLHNSDPWVAMNSGSPYVPTNMPSTVDTISAIHYWTIDRTDGAGNPASNTNLSAAGNQITLYFGNTGNSDQVKEGSELTIVKTNATAGQWIDIGGSGGPAYNGGADLAGSITSTGSPSSFNSFSSFSLGSLNGGWNPLPIELLSFTAVANGDKVDVKWETTTETNNAYFTIEKSKDGVNFTKVVDVPGAGNSTSYRDYAETDYQPYVGTSYYRLKQTDRNGVYKYFTMVPVTFVPEGQQSIFMFPNPMMTNGTDLSVKVIGYQSQEVLVVLRDIQGKEYLSKVLLSDDESHLFIIDGTKSLPIGSYIVTASSNNKIYNYKIIVR